MTKKDMVAELWSEYGGDAKAVAAAAGCTPAYARMVAAERGLPKPGIVDITYDDLMDAIKSASAYRDDEGFYRKQSSPNERYPRISTLIAPFTGYAREEGESSSSPYARAGTAIHECVASEVIGIPATRDIYAGEPDEVKAIADRYFDAAVAAVASLQEQCKHLLPETSLACPDGYGGTIDVIGWRPDGFRVTIYEFKTGNQQPWHHLQLAAQQHMLTRALAAVMKRDPGEIRGAVVYLQDGGKFRVVWQVPKYRAAWRGFLMLKEAGLA